MAIALVGSIVQAQAVSNPSSPSLDTTGANLLIAITHDYEPTAAGTLTDSKGNTWTPLTAYTRAGATRQRIYYVTNSPTVGSGHTITYTVTNIYGVVTFLAFSGAHATAPFDTENGGGFSNTTFQAGSVTPAVDGSLILAALTYAQTRTVSINLGFSTPVQTDYNGGTAARGGAVAYLVQGTAASVDPTWSGGGSGEASAAVAVFAPGAGGGDVTPAPAAGALSLAGTTGRLGFTINLPDEA
jgi:hypothetical protein